MGIVVFGLDIGVHSARVGSGSNQKLDGVRPTPTPFKMHCQLHGDARGAISEMQEKLLAGATVKHGAACAYQLFAKDGLVEKTFRLLEKS